MLKQCAKCESTYADTLPLCPYCNTEEFELLGEPEEQAAEQADEPPMIKKGDVDG